MLPRASCLTSHAHQEGKAWVLLASVAPGFQLSEHLLRGRRIGAQAETPQHYHCQPQARGRHKRKARKVRVFCGQGGEGHSNGNVFMIAPQVPVHSSHQPTDSEDRGA